MNNKEIFKQQVIQILVESKFSEEIINKVKQMPADEVHNRVTKKMAEVSQ